MIGLCRSMAQLFPFLFACVDTMIQCTLGTNLACGCSWLIDETTGRAIEMIRFGEQTEVYCSHAHGLRRSGWKIRKSTGVS